MAELPANLYSYTRGGSGEAARLLKEVVDRYAEEGFEFFRVDTFSVERPAGCLFFGRRLTTTYNVVTLRRER